MFASHIVTVFCLALVIHYAKSNRCSEPGSKIECSNRGTCKLNINSDYSLSEGYCICHKRERPDEIYTGSYCQCDNFTCGRHDGQLCSGLENGYCYCGKCHCADGRTGSVCECPIAMDACKSTESEGSEPEICSGHGVCNCGKCSCFGGFSGPQCLSTIEEVKFNKTLLDLLT